MNIEKIVDALRVTAEQMYERLGNAGIKGRAIDVAVEFLEKNFGNQMREADDVTPITVGHLYPSVVRLVDYLSFEASKDRDGRGVRVPHVALSPALVVATLFHDVMDDYLPLKSKGYHERKQFFAGLFGYHDGNVIYGLDLPLSGPNWKELGDGRNGGGAGEEKLRLLIEQNAVSRLEIARSWPSDLIKIVERSTNLDWLPIPGRSEKTDYIIAKTAKIFFPFVKERSTYWAGQYRTALNELGVTNRQLNSALERTITQAQARISLANGNP